MWPEEPNWWTQRSPLHQGVISGWTNGRRVSTSSKLWIFPDPFYCYEYSTCSWACWGQLTYVFYRIRPYEKHWENVYISLPRSLHLPYLFCYILLKGPQTLKTSSTNARLRGMHMGYPVHIMHFFSPITIRCAFPCIVYCIYRSYVQIN